MLLSGISRYSETQAGPALERIAPDWIQVFINRTEAAFAVANAFGPADEFNLVRHALAAGRRDAGFRQQGCIAA